MNGAGSKAKGGAFEREVCKRLSLWLSEGKHDDLLWRSAMSGGRATVQFKKGRANRTQAGDISAIAPQGEKLTRLFLIECKFYRSLDLLGLFREDRAGGIASFWSKCKSDAEKATRLPLLIAKQNRFPELVVVDERGASRLDLASPVAFFPPSGALVYWLHTFLRDARRP